ncbi:MAG: DedA family protein [Alphaproteobacteria bacterium]|nr:DedA family protein [Alphaproteobacteria bacterium]
MIRSLYDWTMRAASHKHAVPALFGVSFVESSFFPIPPDIMLIPMVLAKRAKAWFYATVATVGSVLGGVFGYLIGYFLFESIGRPMIEFYGYAEKFATFAAQYNDYGAWIVFVFGVTPFPYKVITIASGATQLNIFMFLLASVLSRGLRFFVVAALLYWFGPPIRDFIERRLGLVFTVFVVLLFGGFIAIRYLL